MHIVNKYSLSELKLATEISMKKEGKKVSAKEQCQNHQREQHE